MKGLVKDYFDQKYVLTYSARERVDLFEFKLCMCEYNPSLLGQSASSYPQGHPFGQFSKHGQFSGHATAFS